ncbi:hypothetical protein FHS57_004845 [Runella defluvii]|uniref:Uncharacterized protein n=1 Tax=Runella defluvii TaxID=370973 RepID=A0A7W6ESK6_9BACT|nr:hypothetical protein [Runella defluvii]MBB3840825.1 hypothetical protein [Runella defluvii]
MDEPQYPFENPITEIRYDFKSISREKEVNKRVIFTTSDFQNVYNLALVDVLEEGRLSDITESRNKDMKTILATVMGIIINFLEANPGKIIAFKGSDERRQRLYRLIISRDLDELEKEFVILGVSSEGESEPFQSNRLYDYFVILKR